MTEKDKMHGFAVKLSIVLAIMLGPALFVNGCSCRKQSDPNREKTYPVTGIVLYKGQPVEGATVVFSSPTANRGAYGGTDAKGRFSLTTFERGDGAVAGAQQVRISKTEVVQPRPADPEAPLPPARETFLLPKKYAEFKTSGLTAEVKSSGDNHFEFKLTD